MVLGLEVRWTPRSIDAAGHRRPAVLAFPSGSGPDYATSMTRKLLHALLAVATFTVVWLVASPASAFSTRAPVCDPRGAIGFAPPPQIQDAELSLDIPADCFGESPLEAKNFAPGRNSAIDVSSSQEPVSPTASLVLATSVAERLSIPVVECPRPPPGYQQGVDRPPRI